MPIQTLPSTSPLKVNTFSFRSQQTDPDEKERRLNFLKSLAKSYGLNAGDTRRAFSAYKHAFKASTDGLVFRLVYKNVLGPLKEFLSGSLSLSESEQLSFPRNQYTERVLRAAHLDMLFRYVNNPPRFLLGVEPEVFLETVRTNQNIIQAMIFLFETNSLNEQTPEGRTTHSNIHPPDEETAAPVAMQQPPPSTDTAEVATSAAHEPFDTAKLLEEIAVQRQQWQAFRDLPVIKEHRETYEEERAVFLAALAKKKIFVDDIPAIYDIDPHDIERILERLQMMFPDSSQYEFELLVDYAWETFTPSMMTGFIAEIRADVADEARMVMNAEQFVGDEHEEPNRRKAIRAMLNLLKPKLYFRPMLDEVESFKGESLTEYIQALTLRISELAHNKLQQVAALRVESGKLREAGQAKKADDLWMVADHLDATTDKESTLLQEITERATKYKEQVEAKRREMSRTAVIQQQDRQREDSIRSYFELSQYRMNGIWTLAAEVSQGMSYPTYTGFVHSLNQFLEGQLSIEDDFTDSHRDIMERLLRHFHIKEFFRFDEEWEDELYLRNEYANQPVRDFLTEAQVRRLKAFTTVLEIGLATKNGAPNLGKLKTSYPQHKHWRPDNQSQPIRILHTRL